MLYLTVMTTLAQMLVYYMIQKFTLHVVLFIIAARKILSVMLSIWVYNHPHLKGLQILGIILVSGAAILGLVYEKFYASKHREQHELQ